MNTKWEVEYYTTPTGKKPAKNFIDSLPLKMKAKVFRDIELLEEFGVKLNMPYSKQLKEGIHELRVRIGNDRSRILYFFFRDQKIIMTNGFTKKTQRTPPGEIERALKYKADHESRFSE
jgi:phage-related protein